MTKPAIVLAVDFSDCSANAADYALKMAQYMDAQIIIAHAFIRIRPGGLTLGTSVPPIELAEVEMDIDAALKLTKQWAERLRFEGAEVEVVAEVGKPHDIILQTAKKHQASMIIVGNHGHGPVKRFFLGSVAKRVAQDADIPVLVVPLPPE